MNLTNPKYPLYIPSRGRYESRLTSRALESMGVPYYIVVEEFEYEKYCEVIDKSKVLILPERYFDEYQVCDNLGRTKSTGPGAARNFIWDHSVANGFKWHWVMDDNIRRFLRFHNNSQITARTGGIFRAMEDFCERYQNVAMAGPNYFMFVPRKQKQPPFVLNTRIYSCNLIKNDAPYRWRGRYNEDTDLSLRMLKDGWCTVQFNAFLQEKTRTQVLKGGNTEVFYSKEGTYPKSKMLLDLHPNVTDVVMRFGRVHHHVNYLPFKKNKLIRDSSVQVTDGDNEYGMKLKNKNGNI